MAMFKASTFSFPRRHTSSWRLWQWFMLAAVGWLLGLRVAVAAELLVDQRPVIPVWPAVTWLSDPEHSLRAEELASGSGTFTEPTSAAGNLGRRNDTVWLRLPLNVMGIEPVQRVLDIDYPALNRVDVYVVRQGRITEQHRLGNELPLSERPLPTRTHAVTLTLTPGEQTLLLRVKTQSSMVLPMTLRSEESLLQKESQIHLLQGLIAGLALCMMIYSLAHWVTLRDSLFLAYALLVASNLLFIGSYFGVTSVFVWPEWPELSTRISPLAVFGAVAAGSTFLRGTLAVREISLFIDRFMLGSAIVAASGLVLGIAGLLSYAQQHVLATVLGLIVVVAIMPVALIRTWRGERVALYTVFGWTFYILGAVTTAGLLRGYFQPNFFTMYCYPISTMVEMSAWMAVLSLRVQSIHRNADRARLESETLRTLAHTDALTGLPNRRGLQAHLAGELERCTPQRLLAVYLLDLDGFKPVNDQYGHDVGDALLVAVGQRLSMQLRGSDVVARLGGDEFVVLAAGLADENTARALGQKMLAAFNEPFSAAGQTCSVGLTIGYALSPLDATGGEELLKRADAAMYAGKQGGRRQVVRGGRKADLATA